MKALKEKRITVTMGFILSRIFRLNLVPAFISV
jgi:hypothetical protein